MDTDPRASSGPPLDLEAYYDDFPRVEEAFGRDLGQSLHPRGPELLHDLVRELALPEGSLALDVGCGEGGHAVRLATELSLVVHGVDPVARHVELAREAAAESPVAERLTFAPGHVEALPLHDASFDLVWCRDVLVHVADLPAAYAEMRRVLRPGGAVLVYQMFATPLLEPAEAAWLLPTMRVVPGSVDRERTEQAIAGAGLLVQQRLELGSQRGEVGEERAGRAGRALLHAARLRRDPERYRSRYGQAAYDIMLGDCLWHVYPMLGKLSPCVYLLTGP